MSERRRKTYTVAPIEGQSYHGRQWGWRVLRNGFPFVQAVTGGSGPCWNIGEDDNEANLMHVCDLDDLIAALIALRNSDADRLNTERWDISWSPLNLAPSGQTQGGSEG